MILFLKFSQNTSALPPKYLPPPPLPTDNFLLNFVIIRVLVYCIMYLNFAVIVVWELIDIPTKHLAKTWLFSFLLKSVFKKISSVGGRGRWEREGQPPTSHPVKNLNIYLLIFLNPCDRFLRLCLSRIVNGNILTNSTNKLK